MPKFSVPAGCRDAMTALNAAHTERYNKLKGIASGYADKFNNLKAFTTKLHSAHNDRLKRVVNHMRGKMIASNLESDKILSAYMDTHETMRQTIANVLTDFKKQGTPEGMPRGTVTSLKQAADYAADVHDSLIGKKSHGSDVYDPSKVEDPRSGGSGMPPRTEQERSVAMSPAGHLERIMAHLNKKYELVKNPPIARGSKGASRKFGRRSKPN